MPFIQLQFRRDSSSNWTSNNPTLASGELGIETDTNLFKIGSGTNWVGTSYGGLQGVTGATATIAVGTVTTLSPGATATVADSGTSYASVFDFGIPQGATGGTEGIQYNLTGSTIGGTYTSYPTGTTFPVASTWTLMTGITFTVPPNWSSTKSVSWDGWALYDFSFSNVNYWTVYYTTTSQSTEQPLIANKNTNNAIYSSSPQMYFPMNLVIPPTYLEAGPTGTINLRVYSFINSATVTLSNTPQIHAKVSLLLD